MIKLKKIVTFAMALCLFIISVSAENVSYKVIIDEDKTSFASDSLMSDVDYSDLSVTAVKYSKGNWKIIYKGALGGYADGNFKNVDFSKINFLVLSALEGDNDTTVYVIPDTNQTTLNATLNATARTSSTIQIDMSLMYNNKYYESVLLPGQALTIPLTVTNTGSSEAEIVPYIAKYNLSGRLTDLRQGNLISVPANQTTTASISNEFNNDTNCTAKIYFWQKDTLKPVASNINLKTQPTDYYADGFAQANKINYNQQLCGVINGNTDVDIIKFTPQTEGLYTIQLNASSGVVCGLYTNTQVLLSSTSATNGKDYLIYPLFENQNYYIRFNGMNNNTYEISAPTLNEYTILEKNIGSENILSDNNYFHIYKFIPPTNGNYIITAVDSSGVKADLYDSAFVRVASSSESDASISFRLSYDMTENQPYYIVVYPKSENASGSYTMYAEEPFALISVE